MFHVIKLHIIEKSEQSDLGRGNNRTAVMGSDIMGVVQRWRQHIELARYKW